MADMWVLAGQSNMEGVGDLVDVEAPSQRVRLFAHGDEWKRAEEPLHWLLEANDEVHQMGITGAELERARRETRRDRNKGAGLGLAFAKKLVASADVDIDLIPCAHGGTSMEQWDPGKKGLRGQSLYGATLRRVRLALETSGGSKLRGILWYQGESDADPSTSLLYRNRMHELIQSFRMDLEAPGLPFYIVQLGPFSIGPTADGAADSAWSRIREIQRLLPTEIPNTATAPAIDLDLDDGIHIGTLGLKRLGRRLANVALTNVYGIDSPKPITLAGVKREGGAIRVTYSGVNGSLVTPDPGGRVSGFTIGADEGNDPTIIFKAKIDPAKPNEVLLFLRDEPPANPKLWYGYGFDSFCQLADTSDMAAPAFGPVGV